MRLAVEHGGPLERCERRLDVPQQQLGASPSTMRLAANHVRLDVTRLEPRTVLTFSTIVDGRHP
jgi:hypothetical protein